MPPQGSGSAVSSSSSAAETEENEPLISREENEEPARLTIMTSLAYGVGHVLNDVCASMWFSYTLLFLHSVLGMPGTHAGAILMLGQVIDALATPLVGMLADRPLRGPLAKYGRRKLCHLIGIHSVIIIIINRIYNL